MSSKNKKSTKKRRADQEAAASYETNSSMFATDLTVAQLQQVLIGRGVTASELKKLKKAELVQRVQATGSTAQRVSASLDSHASEAEGKHHSSDFFSRLGTALVVHTAQFLDLGSLASTARVSRFLRLRLSLSLKGTPSHALTRLQQLSLKSAQCTTQFVTAALSRIGSLQSLKYRAPPASISLPGSLRHVDVAATPDCFSKYKLLQALHQCQDLESLVVHRLRAIDKNDFLPFVGRPWPKLRTLQLLEVCEDTAKHVLSCVPELKSLSLSGMSLDFDQGPVHTLTPKLERLSLVNCTVYMHTFVEFSAWASMRELTVEDCGFEHMQHFSTLPKTLTRLCFDGLHGTVYGRLSTGMFPSLRHLSILRQSNAIEEVFEEKEVHLPELESFAAYYFGFPSIFDTSLEFVENLVTGEANSTPKLASLLLHYELIGYHRDSPPERQKWTKWCRQITAIRPADVAN